MYIPRQKRLQTLKGTSVVRLGITLILIYISSGSRLRCIYSYRASVPKKTNLHIIFELIPHYHCDIKIIDVALSN